MATYVIGHKNPDTDAICSALAYADFLQKTSRPEAVAARCGEVSSRTAYALERAGLDHPRLVMDVRLTAGQICHRKVITANTEESLYEVINRMRASDLRSIPVLDADNEVKGMVSMQKLVDLLLPGEENGHEARIVDSSLQRICKVLGGQFQNACEPEQEEQFLLTVAALSSVEFNKRLSLYDPKKLLVVVGDRPTIQHISLEDGVRGMVITGGNRLNDDLLRLAQQQKVSVILSPKDTATTTLLIKCSKKILHAIRTEFISFGENSTIEEIRDSVQSSPQVLFPVLDKNRKLAGVFSKSDLVSPPVSKLILVDHNEFSQAVTGVEEAEILEVIDHHRLGGGLTSKEPIRFVNEPVGSTCTIVARTFRQSGLKPSPSIALAMAAGIISDTLFLTSPTTTASDKEILEWLAGFTSQDLKKFGDEFFAAGSLLQVSSPAQAVRADCKEYEEHGWKIAVAQIEEQSLDPLWLQKDALVSALCELNDERNLDFSCLLVTDITKHYSVLLTAGSPRVINVIDYPRMEEGVYELPGIVSRKKQLLPHLIWILNKVRKE